MSLRLKSHWHKDKHRSLDEISSAIGFIIWKIAANGLLELENEGFATYSNDHRLNVVAEYLAFMLQVTDRMVYERLDAEERAEFINGLANYLAMTFVENKQELYGAGDYRTGFIALLNERAEQYASLTFADNEAKLDFLRLFGDSIQAIMGDKDKKWISQYIIEVEAPPAVKRLAKSMDDLFS